MVVQALVALILLNLSAALRPPYLELWTLRRPRTDVSPPECVGVSLGIVRSDGYRDFVPTVKLADVGVPRCMNYIAYGAKTLVAHIQYHTADNLLAPAAQYYKHVPWVESPMDSSKTLIRIAGSENTAEKLGESPGNFYGENVEILTVFNNKGRTNIDLPRWQMIITGMTEEDDDGGCLQPWDDEGEEIVGGIQDLLVHDCRSMPLVSNGGRGYCKPSEVTWTQSAINQNRDVPGPFRLALYTSIDCEGRAFFTTDALRETFDFSSYYDEDVLTPISYMIVSDFLETSRNCKCNAGSQECVDCTEATRGLGAELKGLASVATYPPKGNSKPYYVSTPFIGTMANVTYEGLAKLCKSKPERC